MSYHQEHTRNWNWLVSIINDLDILQQHYTDTDRLFSMSEGLQNSLQKKRELIIGQGIPNSHRSIKKNIFEMLKFYIFVSKTECYSYCFWYCTCTVINFFQFSIARDSSHFRRYVKVKCVQLVLELEIVLFRFHLTETVFCLVS